MASALQTLIKILQLEQHKGFENKAVIGGFGRFAFHWAREAHGQAKTDAHHALVDEIAELLREYEELTEADRPAAVDHIVSLAKGEAEFEMEREVEAETSPPKPTPTKAQYTPRDSASEGDEFAFLFEDDDDEDDTGFQPETPSRAQSLRERRGYAHQPANVVDMDVLEGLNAHVVSASGVGDKRAEQLEKLNLRTIRDMLYFFPRRYDDYSRLKVIRQLVPGEEVTVIGTMERIQAVPIKGRGTRVEAYLNDGTGFLRINWFNQPWMEKQLEDGEGYVVSGKVEQFLGRIVMNSPELEELEKDWLHTGRVVPVYRLTQGLSGRVMRNLMKPVIDEWTPRLPDPLPEVVRENADLMDHGDAISQAHFPDTWEDKEAALYRLAFDEVFTLHVAMLGWRRDWQSRPGTPLPVDDDWIAGFESTLPYALTGAQRRAVADLQRDVAGDVPMNRLIQGDVGSGKTVVTAIALGIAVAHGKQAALMAPTSILAEQHFMSVQELLFNALGDGVRVALLTGNTSQADRNDIYAGLADGSIHVVVGTHALIQDGVTYADLCMVVVDEQHRFGVNQRGALRDKAVNGNPHLLVTTATPIPRTLALTLHADLDLTVIDEMPPGREAVDTKVIQPKERERAYAFIRSQIEKGHQAFIIYPLIDESEKLDVKAAVPEFERLQETVFADRRLALLHGRMSADEKEQVMTAFYSGDLDILVSTTVIEVGIDVPNATVMLIEGANRFGLAQLHQLRGRVGRGGNKGYCLLMSDKASLDDDSRLSSVANTTDGFKLAQIDWEMRGAGDLLGERQSGLGTLDYVQMIDSRLIDQVQHEAQQLFARDPNLEFPEHHFLRDRVRSLSRPGDVS